MTGFTPEKFIYGVCTKGSVSLIFPFMLNYNLFIEVVVEFSPCRPFGKGLNNKQADIVPDHGGHTYFSAQVVKSIFILLNESNCSFGTERSKTHHTLPRICPSTFKVFGIGNYIRKCRRQEAFICYTRLPLFASTPLSYLVAPLPLPTTLSYAVFSVLLLILHGPLWSHDQIQRLKAKMWTPNLRRLLFPAIS